MRLEVLSGFIEILFAYKVNYLKLIVVNCIRSEIIKKSFLNCSIYLIFILILYQTIYKLSCFCLILINLNYFIAEQSIKI